MKLLTTRRQLLSLWAMACNGNYTSCLVRIADKRGLLRQVKVPKR